MPNLQYSTVNGTDYTSDTPDTLIKVLESSRASGERITITYGNIHTGKAWTDKPESGTIGRTTGNSRIPILIKTKRSLGGGAILTNSIIKITAAKGQVLYQGPVH